MTIDFFIQKTISRTRFFNSFTWNWRWCKTRENRFIEFERFFESTITWQIVYRIRWRLFNWINLILVCFKLLVTWFHMYFRLRLGIPFPLFIFALFGKTTWNRVVGFMTIFTVFPKLWHTLIIRISCLCQHDFKIFDQKFQWINFEIRRWTFHYWFPVVDQEYEFFSFATFSSTAILISVWNGMERSNTVDA